MLNPSEISDILKQQLENVNNKVKFEEVGTVLEVGDGVAHVYGLENVRANELVEFENGVKGVALNLEESNVGVVLLNNINSVSENMTVRRTGEIASIPVGEGLLGRVINILGEPIDGKGPIDGKQLLMPLERKAPGVIFRQPVKQPLQTGLKAIDSMIPIGRGQRELIIGDRQIGKTAIAIDTIINQRANYEAGKPVYCIYVAIGQKASSIASTVHTLEKFGAMPYTVVVAASASDSASMRYYAPFAGVAIGEYFRDTGRDALIVYDDLSKQAVAYRLSAQPSVGTCSKDYRQPGGGSEHERPSRGAQAHSERRRLTHRSPHHRDSGRRRFGIYPHKRNFNYRRSDLP